MFGQEQEGMEGRCILGPRRGSTWGSVQGKTLLLLEARDKVPLSGQGGCHLARWVALFIHPACTYQTLCIVGIRGPLPTSALMPSEAGTVTAPVLQMKKPRVRVVP